MKILAEYRTPFAAVLNNTLAEGLLTASTDSQLDLDGQDLDYGFGGDW